MTVKEKTPKTTISPAEFRKVRRGMSRASVSRIVGFAGRFGGSYAGKTLRIYDMMPFWRWAIVTYRNGRVVGKMWNVAHD